MFTKEARLGAALDGKLPEYIMNMINNLMKKPIQAVKDFCVSRIKLVGADGKG